MTLNRRVRTEPGAEVIRTCGPFTCGPGCGLLAHVKDGRLIKVEPGDHPPTSHICSKGLSAVKHVYHPDRLQYPLRRTGDRGEGKWERISWDEALDTIAGQFTEITEKYGPGSVAFVMDFMAMLATDAVIGFTGACQGTFLMTSGDGDSGGVCNDKVCLGSPWWYGEDYTTRFDDIKFLINWGGNPADTDTFKWQRIRDAKENGARFVAVDPLLSTTASKADEYVQIRPGTDSALALGMMNVILEKGLQDDEYILENTVGPFLVHGDTGAFLREKDLAPGDSEKYLVWDTKSGTAVPFDAGGISPALTGTCTVNGIECAPAFQLLADLVKEFAPPRASDLTGIPADTIKRLGVEYATKKPAASFRGMGCQRTFHGDLTYHALNSLAAITGNISTEGHTPFEVNHLAFMKHGIPKFMPIMLMYDAILSGDPHHIKSLWITRHNLVNSIPNFHTVVDGLLPKLDLIVAVDLFMSASAKYADIVLPACSIYECSDFYLPIGNGSHNYIILQQKAIEPLYESKSDVEIVRLLAKRMGIEGFLDGTDEELIDQLLNSGHPSMEGITVKSLKEGPMEPSPCDMPKFATPSGRIEFYLERLLEYGQELPYFREPLEGNRRPLGKKYPLSLITPHPRFRTHSMYANNPWLRQLDPEPLLEINRADAEARGIEDGSLVRMFNDRGEVTVKVKYNQGVMEGVLKLEEGWPPEEFISGTHQSLTHETLNPAQRATFEPNAAVYDVLVDVEPVKEVR